MNACSAAGSSFTARHAAMGVWEHSGRDLHSHVHDLGFYGHSRHAISESAGQRPIYVSEGRLHQIANALWGLSSFLTMRGNSADTRLAQGWMPAGVLALDRSGNQESGRREAPGTNGACLPSGSRPETALRSDPGATTTVTCGGISGDATFWPARGVPFVCQALTFPQVRARQPDIRCGWETLWAGLPESTGGKNTRIRRTRPNERLAS